MILSFVVEGFQAVIERLARAREKVETPMSFIVEAGIDALGIFKANAPKSQGNSHGDHAADYLTYSIQGRLSGGVEADIEVGKPFRYLFFVNDGTKSHQIKGNPLSWTDRATGQRNYAKFVVVKGITGTHWIEKSRQQVNLAIAALGQQYIDTIGRQ